MAFDRSEFLATFNDEAKDHLQKLNQGLLALEKKPDDETIIEEMFREGHTLKGASRMMGFEELKDVSHHIEDIFGALLAKKITLNSNLTDLLFQSLDTMSDILVEVVNQKKVTVPWKSISRKLKKEFEIAQSKPQKKKEKLTKKSTAKKRNDKKLSDITTPETHSDEKIPDSPPKNPFDDLTPEQKEALDAIYEDDSSLEENENQDTIENEFYKTTGELSNDLEAKQESQLEEFIKVPLTKINKLLNLVGEMVINKINSNQKISNIRQISKTSRIAYKKMVDLHNQFNSVAHKLTDHRDELKLAFNDVSTQLNNVREDINTLYDAISIEVSQLDPIVDELQLRMKQIRMLPVGSVFETMPRLVRDIAHSQNKSINLNISGEETELDKKVLEMIKSSLIHLLRNAVDHGIELGEERSINGKPIQGNIWLRAFHKGGNVIIEIEDDGRGIDSEKIKKSAIKKGILSKKEISLLQKQDIIHLLFTPGFSTAPIITDISGRGVGLDVVKNEIESLKGNIFIRSEKSKGTCFTLQLPLTVAIIQSLLIRCGKDIFAIPLLSVEESICISRNKIFSIENRLGIRLREKTISVLPLKEVLKLPDENNQPDNDKKVFIVILNSLEKLLGIEVDEIIGEQEIFIKSLDPKLGKLRNVSGATVLGSGQVIIILDPVDLFESSKEHHFHHKIPTITVETDKNTKPNQESNNSEELHKKSILIAEDSLTTRELERSILESHGYKVETAIDGLDALNKANSASFDLIISDVEMPRMQGFELCKNIKKNPNTQHVPVIIVTSLGREEDKRKGIEVGAQAYIVKSTFDQTTLIETVERLIG